MAQKEYQLLIDLGAKVNESFTGSFSSAEKIIAKAQREIQALGKLQGDISSYEKQSAALEKSQKKLESYEKSAELVENQLKELEALRKRYSESGEDYDEAYFIEKEGELRERQLALERNSESTSSTIERQAEALARLEGKLKDAGVNTEDLSGESKRLSDEMDDLKKAEEDAADAAKDFGDKSTGAFELIGDEIVNSGIREMLKFIASAYKECVSLSSEFGATMSEVEALATPSDTEMEQLEALAKQLGADTKFDANEAAEAMTYMGMAGWKASEMLEGMNGTLMLAAASGEDLATVSDIVTDDLTAFGLGAADAAHFSDVLAAASSNSNTNVALMGETFKYVAPLFGTMNWSAESAAVAVGLMANAGIKGTQAGTSLKTAISNLVSPSKQMKKEMDELGISIENADGSTKSFDEVMIMLRDRFSGLSEAEQAASASIIFGKEAMSGMLNIINASESDFVKLTNAVNNCAGSAERMANVKMDNLAGDVELMNSAADGLRLTIGDAMEDELRSLAKAAAGVLDFVNSFAEKNPALVKSLITMSGVLAGIVAIYPIYIGYQKAKNAVDTINNILRTAAIALTKKSTAEKTAETAATVGATVAQNGFNAALAANPVGAILTGLALLIPLITTVSEKLKKAKEEQEALTVQCRALNDTFDDTNKVYEETTDKIAATVSLTDDYIERLRTLEAQGLRTRTEKEAYALVVEKLNALYPELNAEIDENTGCLKNGIKAIEDYAAAWEEQSMSDAFRKKQSERLAAVNDAEVELYENRAKLLLAEAEFEDAEGRRATSWDIRNSNLGLNLGASAEEIGDLRDAVAAGEEALAKAKAELENVDAAQALYNEGLDDTSDSIDGVTGKISKLEEAYETAYFAAYDSISGQFKLWEEAETVEAKSIDEIAAALESQTAYWENYNRDLALLSDRNIEGLDELVSAYSDGSEESVSFIASLAQATDEEIAHLIELIEKNEDQIEKTASGMALVSEEFLEAKEQYENSFDELKNELNISDYAAEAADDAMTAYIDALRKREGDLASVIGEITSIIMLMTPGTPKSYVRDRGSLPGYASGTDSAERGYALVGENGPELIYFGGGEVVYNADVTRRLSVDAEALGTMIATAPSVASSNTQSLMRRYEINISPRIELNGGSITSDDEARIAESIRDIVVSTIQDLNENERRTAYI